MHLNKIWNSLATARILPHVSINGFLSGTLETCVACGEASPDKCISIGSGIHLPQQGYFLTCLSTDFCPVHWKHVLHVVKQLDFYWLNAD